MKKTNILGVNFNHIRHLEALEVILRALNEKKTLTVFTPNPEIVMEAYHDMSFREILNQGDLVVPDGIGVVIGSRLIGRALPERVAGYDLVQAMFSSIAKSTYTVYFFGAKEGVAQQAQQAMEKAYPGLKIVGCHHGYTQNTQEVLKHIQKVNPDIVLIGLGAPRQERFIIEHREQLANKVLIGVGGSFDGMAGIVKRAPDIFIKLGLEWFYRLIKQPSRFIRMLRLPYFLLKVVIEGKRYE